MKNLLNKIIVLISSLLVISAQADDTAFMELVKKTNSTYSGQAQVDINNPATVKFETLLKDQKVFLAVSATHLNSTFFTLVNADNSLLKNNKNITVPTVEVKDFNIVFTNGQTTASCDGSDVATDLEVCTNQKCTIKQRFISKCNELNCWKENPNKNYKLTEEIDESFDLNEKIDISACLPNNEIGQKHSIKFTVGNNSTPVNAPVGGSINYSVIVQNDTYL